MDRRAKQHWLYVHNMFYTICMLDPAIAIFPKLYASYLLWNLSFSLLAKVCYTADCNVFTLRRLFCSSTLPLFVLQTKHSAY